MRSFLFFKAEDGIRDGTVTGVQTCALPIYFLRTRSTALPPCGPSSCCRCFISARTSFQLGIGQEGLSGWGVGQLYRFFVPPVGNYGRHIYVNGRLPEIYRRVLKRVGSWSEIPL